MSIHEAWTRLRTVSQLSFEAHSQANPNTGWNGCGTGSVQVEQPESLTLIFHEKGRWTPETERGVPFSNVFRWTLAPEGQFIRLEHLRFGVDHPVYLFDLVTASERVLVSFEPHVCREDFYAARLELDQQTIQLRWTISGPKKNESISYLYK